jgi:hypothetical protein
MAASKPKQRKTDNFFNTTELPARTIINPIVEDILNNHLKRTDTAKCESLCNT